MADTCSFADDKNENVRDRLVVGILGKELSEKLQLTPDLTLDKAVELVRQSEQVKGHVSEQGACASGGTQLSEVAKRGQRSTTAKPEHRHVQRKGNNAKPAPDRRGNGCYRCGKHHAKGDSWPARNAECHSCKKMGHYASMCRSFIVNEVSAHAYGNGQSHTPSLGAITQVTDINDAWIVKLPI